MKGREDVNRLTLLADIRLANQVDLSTRMACDFVLVKDMSTGSLGLLHDESAQSRYYGNSLSYGCRLELRKIRNATWLYLIQN